MSRRDVLTLDGDGDVIVPDEALESPALGELLRGANSSVIVSTSTREIALDEAIRGGELGRVATDELHETVPKLPNAIREIFSGLYQSDADVIASDVNPDRDWIASVVNAARDVPEWRELESKCSGDEWAAGISTAALFDALKDAGLFKDPPKEDPEELEQVVETLEEAGVDPTDERMIEAQAAAAAAAEAAAQYAAKIAKDRKAIAAIVSEAARGVGEEIDVVRLTMQGFGMGFGSELGTQTKVRGPIPLVREIVRKNPKLQNVARLAGRLRAEAAAKQITKSAFGRENVIDVEMGDDLGRLLPSELSAFGDETLETNAYRKIIERTALQYEMNGTETKTRGPIMICLDQSGSMAGTPDQWAKAVCYALLEVASKERRSFGVVLYDGHVTGELIVPNGSISIQQLEEFIDSFSGGGTNTLKAIDHALSMIEGSYGSLESKATKAGSEFVRASDLIVITDGEYGIEDRDSNRLRERLKRNGVSIYGIAIGGRVPSIGGGLDQLCSSLVAITEKEMVEGSDGKLDAIFSV